MTNLESLSANFNIYANAGMNLINYSPHYGYYFSASLHTLLSLI